MAIAVAAAACGLANEADPTPTSTPVAANLLGNPGFESGADPWLSIFDANGLPFEIDTSTARSGERSAAVTLRGGARVSSVVQGVFSGTMPETVSGYYRVDEWTPVDGQYIEVAVAVQGGGFPDGAPFHEVRFLLAGSGTPAPAQSVAYTTMGREPPAPGKWRYFGASVNEAFQHHFSHVPVSADRIDLRLEVRSFAEQGVGDAPVALVRFDDVYAGPAIGNRNRVDDD
jgi:hypothetical protein